jgi:hypothetical protein
LVYIGESQHPTVLARSKILYFVKKMLILANDFYIITVIELVQTYCSFYLKIVSLHKRKVVPVHAIKAY